jgi:N-acyl-D-amino-acid deacylase
MQRKDFVGVAAAGALGLIAAPPAAPAEPPIITSGATSSATKPIDDYMRAFMGKYRIPAGSAAVAKDGRLVYARAFGYRDLKQTTPATPRDRFRIASSSKSITAVAIMQLIQARKLDLDERAFDILSGFAPPNGTTEDPRLRTITIRNLLEHRGGFDSTDSDPQFEALRIAASALEKPAPATHTDIIKYMMGQPLAFAPGTKYVYSNLGYNVLGRVIEHIAGLDYGTYVKANVLAPAGISRMELGRTKPKDRLPDEVEAWDDPNCNTMYSVYEDDFTRVPSSYGGFSMEAIDAHGGWLASTIDLTRFLNAVAGSTGHQLLAPSTAEIMLSKPDLPKYRNADHYYAMGWAVGNGMIMNHNGALTWGTASTIGRLAGGLTYAACFNRLGYDRAFADGLMTDSANAIKSVSAWPSTDLYPQLG